MARLSVRSSLLALLCVGVDGLGSTRGLSERAARPLTVTRRSALALLPTLLARATATMADEPSPAMTADEPSLAMTADEPSLAMTADEPSLQRLKALGDGSRRLEEGDIADGLDLVGELLRRTEQNREKNEAATRRVTQQNAFTAIDGSVNRRLVTDLNGENRYLSASEVRALTQERRLACAPSVMEACRMIRPSDTDAPPLQLPEVKALRCDEQGRNCKFR